MAKASERDRYEYGVCINRDRDGKPCPKCESKEVQKIRKGQDFICEECKDPMRKVPPPKSKTPLGMITGIAVAAIIVCGLVVYLLFFNSDKGKTPAPDTKSEVVQTVVAKDTVQTVAEDTIKKPEIPVKEKKVEKDNVGKVSAPSVVATKNATLDLGYATYTGDMKSGKANGTGRLVFKTRHAISAADPQNRMAERGDYLDGQFENNQFYSGKWFGSDGAQKGAIILQKSGIPSK